MILLTATLLKVSHDRSVGADPFAAHARELGAATTTGGSATTFAAIKMAIAYAEPFAAAFPSPDGLITLFVRSGSAVGSLGRAGSIEDLYGVCVSLSARRDCAPSPSTDQGSFDVGQ